MIGKGKLGGGINFFLAYQIVSNLIFQVFMKVGYHSGHKGFYVRAPVFCSIFLFTEKYEIINFSLVREIPNSFPMIAVKNCFKRTNISLFNPRFPTDFLPNVRT